MEMLAGLNEMIQNLYQIFQKLGFVIIVLAWLSAGNNKRVDAFEMLQKLVFIFFTISAIFYFPKIVNSGMILFQNLAESFRRDHEVLTKTLEVAVLNANGGWFPDLLAAFTAITVSIGFLVGSGLTQLIYAFGNMMSVFIICVAPMMLACIMHDSLKSLGLGFLKYSAIIMMLPIGIMIVDFFHLTFLRWLSEVAHSGFSDPNVSGPGLVLKILANPDSVFDKGSLDGKQFGLTYLLSMGLTSVAFGFVIIVGSPWIVYKLFGTGDVSGVASQIGGVAQSAAAPAARQMTSLAKTASKSGPSVRTSARVALRGAQGIGHTSKRALSSTSRRLLNRSTPQDASKRKPKY